MADQVDTYTYDRGDWVVHLHHGVGEIQEIEEKALGGSATTYYKVVTSNKTLWVPIDKAENRWFRPLATEEEFDRVIEILKRPPQEMHSNHNKRKKRIKDVKSDNSLEEMARLIRDLWARRANRKLNNTEERALRRFTDRLLREWSVAKGLDEEEARQRMRSLQSTVAEKA